MEETAVRDGMHIGTIGALAMSVISSVSIIICNKTILSIYSFHFASTLTCYHFLVTYVTLHLARVLELFEHRPLDSFSVLKFGFLNGISAVLLNLTLCYNSIGFYQMAKIAIIPFTVLIEMFYYGKRFSQRTQISILILLIGVGIATFTDLQLNFLGCVLSLLAIATTCVAQIMISTIQQSSQVSATQLLYQARPYQALTLLIIGLSTDELLTEQTLFNFEYNPHVLFFIVISCFLSVAVNFSTFLVIGKTSPVTYQVLEHLKSCLVLVFGYTLFHNPLNWRNILGIFIAMIGMILYTFASINIAPQVHASRSESIGSSLDTIQM